MSINRICPYSHLDHRGKFYIVEMLEKLGHNLFFYSKFSAIVTTFRANSVELDSCTAV